MAHRLCTRPPTEQIQAPGARPSRFAVASRSPSPARDRRWCSCYCRREAWILRQRRVRIACSKLASRSARAGAGSAPAASTFVLAKTSGCRAGRRCCGSGRPGSAAPPSFFWSPFLPFFQAPGARPRRAVRPICASVRVYRDDRPVEHERGCSSSSTCCSRPANRCEGKARDGWPQTLLIVPMRACRMALAGAEVPLPQQMTRAPRALFGRRLAGVKVAASRRRGRRRWTVKRFFLQRRGEAPMRRGTAAPALDEGDRRPCGGDARAPSLQPAEGARAVTLPRLRRRHPSMAGLTCGGSGVLRSRPASSPPDDFQKRRHPDLPCASHVARMRCKEVVAVFAHGPPMVSGRGEGAIVRERAERARSAGR